LARPISASHIDDIKKIIDTAHAAGASLVISLWSFDMLQPRAGAALENNRALLTKDANRDAYITRVLTPLAKALAGYPGLHSWETFNEPEGMSTEHGWTPTRIPMSSVQRTVNWMADAIHQADPTAKVSNGTWTFVANSTVGSNFRNYYSDAALTKAGGRSRGTVDFHQVHYYDNWQTGDSTTVSPFKHPASYWKLDKPIVIGEF